jgi:protein-L-isoaspartate(D-aspartate) O-methyltransferase
VAAERLNGAASDTYGGYRIRLVEALREKGIRDLAVLKAVSEVPRHLFVSASLRAQAYDDTSLPIGNGQTISQPSTQARALEALRLTGREKVLEIGMGSGYQTALLARLAGQVFAVERIPSLAEGAQAALAAAGIRNVSILVGDGTLGWRAYAPYDAMVVAAASPEVPQPLLEQLVAGGRLLLPLGTKDGQTLTLVTNSDEGPVRTPLADARFVPLLGRHGFDA